MKKHFYLSAALVALLAVLGGCAKAPKNITPVPGAYPAFSELRAESGGQMVQSEFAFPSSGEELWIIRRFKSTELSKQEEEHLPGSGSLVTTRESKQVPLPLRDTDVKARVDGYIASVQVQQHFQNPYDSKIEAVYVFPLPENAAVNEFLIIIGSRRIRGIIREREEAEHIYNEAKRQGYVASLLTQERPNIFTQSVANIEPGKEIDVSIHYFNTLAYNDGWFEFVFPMVVGPRFNPLGTTQGIGPVPRGKEGSSGQRAEVSYLKPGERSGHDISLALEINPGCAIEEHSCRTHAVQTRETVSGLKVTLNPADTVPNKDFVFRYRLAGNQVKTAFVTQQSDKGNFFSLMLIPPAESSALGRKPVELVFVLDCSGSMSGEPIAQAKAAIERGLRQLQPDDTFQLINFSNSAHTLGNTPLSATSSNIRKAVEHLQNLKSEGGTMMIEGIKAALDFPHDRSRLRFVCFLTDGYIGNEAEILRAIHQKLGPSRIFSFGIGTSVNRYLLDSMAQVGKGAVAYLNLHESASDIMDDFFARISHPALTDLQIDWTGLQVQDVYPKRLPDLFVGRAVFITGKYSGQIPASIQMEGSLGDDSTKISIPLRNLEAESSQSLDAVWARMRIADLSTQLVAQNRSRAAKQIRQTALDYNLVSDFTSFVAVDASRRTEGEEGTTVPVAVPVPDGVKYSTPVK